jgi:ABC-2 type transport system permease protein
MRTILFLLQKEFLQVFRNKTMLPIIFVVPIVQLLILVNAATFEIKNVNLAIVDHDHSSLSRSLISHFEGSPLYTIVPVEQSMEHAVESINANSSDAALIIPSKFEFDTQNGDNPSIQLLINSINGAAAGLINGYSMGIISNFIMNELSISHPVGMKPSTINVVPRYWFNPELKYSHFMVPGILVILVTIIGMFLTAINLVREKEMGTMEQINVTPIKKYQFILGKLIPFWIIGLVELGFGLFIGWLIFRIPIEGNLLLLFGFAAIYLLMALGVGLFLSATATSQQQVMFMAFFFMIVFILMSGIFTPAESMPQWAQTFNKINPLYYFMKVIRMVLLKGAGLKDIVPYIFAISALALGSITLAIVKFKKTI